MSQAQLANTQNAQNPKVDDLPEGGTEQEWLEVVNTWVHLAKEAGLRIEGKTVPVAEGGSVIVYRIKNAHFCPECGRANLGTDKCHNKKCPRSPDYIQETQNPQAD